MKRSIFLAIAFMVPAVARAHEGHEPLPTKGAVVRGDRLMLSANAAKAIGVTIANVQLADMQRAVNAVGSVELPWSQQAYVSSLIPGRIVDVLVKPGERVSAGQELARVESLELENLQLAMLQPSTQLTYGTRLLERLEILGRDNVIPEITILETRTAVQKERAGFYSAWQKLLAVGVPYDVLQRIHASGDEVRSVAVTSPINGIISAADVRPGQMVSPTEHLFHIVDPSRVWVVGKVLEADAGQVRTKLPVQVTLPTLPDKHFDAQIDHVELRLAADRTLAVKAYLDNSDSLPKAGMFCRLRIVCGDEKTVVCPKDALIGYRDVTFVLVKDTPGNFVRTPIKVGQVNGAVVEVEEGLFPGDKVVTTGSHELAALFASPLQQSPRALDSKSAESSTPTVLAQGRIEVPTRQKLFASAPVDGRIARILVEHGQSVRQGELLAELESLEFQSLQLELIQARAGLQQTSENVERLKNLAASNAMPKQEVWGLLSQHDVSKQTVETLRQSLSVMGLSADEIQQIEETDITDLASAQEISTLLPIRAPGDGQVAQFDLIPGQVVAGQSSLFEIHDPSRMWVRAYVFEQDALGIAPGQSVHVTLVSDPAVHSAGRVDRISPVLVSGNRALSIWIELDNPNRQLKEDMSAVVTIESIQPASRVAVRTN